MLNFTVGPVLSQEGVRKIGGEHTPYFRTAEFSELMLESENLFKRFVNAPEGSRAVFMTGSGTASMETVVMHTLDCDDKVLVVNGGSFGHRFVDMCALHKLNYTELKVEEGHVFSEEDLAQYEGKGFTAFVVNLSETSTGVLYDIQLISDFCKRNDIFLIVDAISAFLADEIDMTKYGIDVVITGSQKALAVPPGISLIALDPKALERVERIPDKSLYLSLKSALVNGERGQTPYTPAVTTLLQINYRLKSIEENGGVSKESEHIGALANDFRTRIQEFPFDFFAERPSNSVTSLKTRNNSAKEIFNILKDEYGIWICPNGGELAETVFRVGHLGNLTIEDNTTLLKALKELQERGVF